MDNKKLSEQELMQVTGGITKISGEEVTAYPKTAGVNAPIVGHGKTGKPTLPLWDEASAGLIPDSGRPGSGNIGDIKK